MILVPIIGQALYLVFGQRYKHRKPINQYRQKATFDYEIRTPHDNDVLVKQANISNRGIYSADVEIFGNINNAYKQLFADLAGAKREINIHYYIIKPGEIFEQFKSIITAKAKQGVKVRLIVDDFGR